LIRNYISFLHFSSTVFGGHYNEAHPFYIWAKEATGNTPIWNFYKYIVGKDGKIIDYFVPLTKPSSKKIKKMLDNNL